MKPPRAVGRRERPSAVPHADTAAEPDRPVPTGSRKNPVLTAAKTVHSALVQLWLAPVRFYRKFLSPLKGQGSCRFTPTCSAYAVGAVREWGILCGTLLAVFRILRCNPFSRGGYDPVPRRAEVFARLRNRFSRRADPDASPGDTGGRTSGDQSSPMER